MNETNTKGMDLIGIATDKNWLRERFFKIIEETFKNCQNLIIKKNSDYTKISPANPFHNFQQEALTLFIENVNISDKIDGITLGLLVRLNDKRRRRENLLLTSGSLVLDESIEDTILDEINYLAILLCNLKIHGHKRIIEKEVQKELSFESMELEEARRDIQRLVREKNYFADELKKEQKLKENQNFARETKIKKGSKG